MKTCKNRWICFISLCLCSLWMSAQGQNIVEKKDSIVQHPSSLSNKPWTVSRFSVRLGAFWAINTTDLGVSLDGNHFTPISFEDDLNMDRNTYSGLFNFDARFGKHHRIDFSYFNIYRNKKLTLDKDIDFGKHTYPIDSYVKAYLNTNIFRLSYGYSFFSNPKFEVGALIGFHVMSFNIGMEFAGETLDLSQQDDVKFTAPLPDLGLWGTYAFHNRWAVSAELSYFYVKLKSLDIDGRLLNANLYAQYKLNNHWEVALGYTGFDVLVNLDRKHLDGKFEWGYSGPVFEVAYKFGK